MPETKLVVLESPGATGTVANAINADGEVVGIWKDASERVHGFRWKAGKFTTVNVPGAESTFPQGINAKGDVVGDYRDAKGRYHGFMQAADGTFETFDVPDSTGTFASGLSDAGFAAGSFWDENGLAHGWVRASGTFATVDVPGASETWCSAVDDRGHVAGTIDLGDAEMSAFLLDASGELRTFTCDGYEQVQATGGLVAGPKGAVELTARLTDGDGRSHGARFRGDGSWTLVAVPDAVEVEAMGLEASGRVVGGFVDGQGRKRGFVLWE